LLKNGKTKENRGAEGGWGLGPTENHPKPGAGWSYWTRPGKKDCKGQGEAIWRNSWGKNRRFAGNGRGKINLLEHKVKRKTGLINQREVVPWRVVR